MAQAVEYTCFASPEFKPQTHQQQQKKNQQKKSQTQWLMPIILDTQQVKTRKKLVRPHNDQ
jgi:hypothetical protein